MMLKRTFVTSSGIEGVGVFAAQPIRAGELIWKLDTEFDRLIDSVSLNSYPDHMREFLERYAYPYHDDPNLLVLEADNGRFMNHSTAPNTRFDEITVGYATQDINVGEELLCNYGEFDPTFQLIPSLTHLKCEVEHGEPALVS